MVGMARRRRPKSQARSAVCEERANPRRGRRCRTNRTPAARRPYHLLSRGAAAPQGWQNHGQQNHLFNHGGHGEHGGENEVWQQVEISEFFVSACNLLRVLRVLVG
jgi:hypothetical protein